MVEVRDLYRGGFVTVPPGVECGARLRLLGARPNPARDEQRFELVLGVSVPRLVVRIVDIAGRRVWTRTFTGLRPGIQSCDWDGRDDDGRALPAGIYFVRADDGRGDGVGRIVRLR